MYVDQDKFMSNSFITKKIVVVLGMHRSGTSAVTRSLQALGVALGDRIMPAAEGNNAKGFWEDIDLNALNVEMLAAVACDWQNPAMLGASDVEALCKQGFLLRAVEMLRSKTVNTPIFGFKDPRVAKLLLFWKKVFEHCQFDVAYVLPVRNPLSVYKSLAARDGMSAEHAYFLWLGHVLGSLADSAGARRTLVDFDRLMQSPKRELERMAAQLDLAVDPAELESFEDQFLDQGLRHSVYELNDLSIDVACPPLVHEVYAKLLDVAQDKLDINDTQLDKQVQGWVKKFQSTNLNPFSLNDLYVRIGRLNDAVRAKNVHIQNIENLLRVRMQEIDQLNHAVGLKDVHIANIENLAKAQEQQIEHLTRLQGENDALNVSLTQTINDRDCEISEFLRSRDMLVDSIRVASVNSK